MGTSDPYLEIRFIYEADVHGIRPPDVVQYSTVCKTTNNPVWDELFSCRGHPDRVEIQICDKDFGLKGKVLSSLRRVGSMFMSSIGTNAKGDEMIGVQTR